MVALPLRLDVGGVATINISLQAPRCLIMTIYKHRITSTVREILSERGMILIVKSKFENTHHELRGDGLVRMCAIHVQAALGSGWQHLA